MKIYISGVITGLPLQKAKKNFDQAEEYIKNELKQTPINPMKLTPYKDGKTWEEYMLDDIKLLFDCQAIYMIQGWKKSKGAKIEHFMAKTMGKKIIKQNKQLNNEQRKEMNWIKKLLDLKDEKQCDVHVVSKRFCVKYVIDGNLALEYSFFL